MQMLKLLSQLGSIEPLLAFPSLSTYEAEMGDDANFDMRVETPEGGPGNTRQLHVAGHSGPLLTGTTDSHGVVTITACGESFPRDIQLVLGAIGSKLDCTEGAVLLQLDLEDYDHRVCLADIAYMTVDRFTRMGLTPDCAEAAASDVLTLAAKWSRNRSLVFEDSRKSPSLLKQRDELVTEAKQIVLRHKWPGIAGIKLRPDPRGSALALVTEQGDQIEVIGLAQTWICNDPDFQGGNMPAINVGSGKFKVKPTQVPSKVLGALAGGVCKGKSFSLTTQLDPQVYRQVATLLTDLGATWVSSQQAHVFERDARGIIGPILQSGTVYTSKDFEFFPTPADLVDNLIAWAGVKPDSLTMEPHAGRAAIAQRLAEVVGQANVKCFELMEENVAHLKKMGFAIEGPTDFLSVKPEPKYQFICMNPPFAKGRDKAHIMHAAKFLAPGGCLTAIASPGWQTATDKESVAFRAFMAKMNAQVRTIPAGAFRESGTEVATVMLKFHASPEQATPSARNHHKAVDTPTQTRLRQRADQEQSQISLF